MPSQLTPEMLIYGLQSAREPQISPDGERIVYTLAVNDPETKKATSQLWLCDRERGSRRRLTWSGERNSGGRWSPDGASIAFVSNRDGDGKTGLFVLPSNGAGEARELTSHRSGISDLAWSSDGSRIAYTASFDPENPDEEAPKEGEPPKVRVTRRIDYKQDGRGYLGDVRQQVWVVDVATGEHRRLTSDLDDKSNPLWSPDGKTLAARISYVNGTRSKLALIDVATGETTLIGTDMSKTGVRAWSPDGSRIVYAADNELNFQMDFYLLDVASGESRRLTDDFAASLDFMAPLVWLDSRQVLFSGSSHGKSILGTLDTETGQVAEIYQAEASNSGLSVDEHGRYIVQSHTSFEETGEIGLFDRTSGEWKVITSFNADLLKEAPPAGWERFEIERGKYTIEAWLLKPPGFDPAKRYPVVLDVHGGPHGHFGYAFNVTQQCLASHGFLVLAVNPRGSTSYGREFTQQVNRDWGFEDYQDLMTALDKVLERPYADPERTGISGYSYGGYMTAWTVGQTQRFKAAFCGAPVFDLESQWGTADIDHAAGEAEFMGDPHEHPDWYAAHSPSTFAHRATTPTLLMQGEADHRCPLSQSEAMFTALKRAGCEVEFVRYPGMSHGFRRLGPPLYQEDSLRRILEWFQHYLG